MAGTPLKPWSVLAALFLALQSVGGARGMAQPPADVVRLDPGGAVERSIGGEHADLYDIALSKDQAARVVVDQKDIELSVRLLSADGTPAIEVDSTKRDPQLILEFVADRSALLRVVLVPRYGNAPAGTYRIQLDQPRTATAGDQMLDEARRRQSESFRLLRSGFHERAHAAAARALEIRTASLGGEHADVADSLALLGLVSNARDQYDQAERYYRQALAIDRRAFGAESAEAARLVDALAKNHNAQRQFAEAIRLAEGSLAMRTRLFGDRHPVAAASLLTLAEIYTDQGDVPKAESAASRALDAAKNAYRPDDLALTDFTKRVALVEELRGNFVRAEELLMQTLQVRERATGPDSLQVADSLRWLGLVSYRRGDDVRAEERFLKALGITEATAGPRHLLAGLALNTLGLVSYRRRDYETAEVRYTRAREIVEEAVGADSVRVAAILNNLGLLYWRRKDYPKAEKAYLRTIALLERHYGPDAFILSSSVNNLGIIYKETGDYDRAEVFYKRSIALVEKANGPDHPESIITIEGLAILYRDRGELARAEPVFLRALTLTEKALGTGHPNASRHLLNLATLYEAMGDMGKARAMFQRMAAIQEENLPLNLAAGSERQKLAYFDSFISTLERVVSFHIRDDRQRESGELAASMLLQRKGRVLDVMADALVNLRNRSDGEDRRQLDELSRRTTELAALVLDNRRSLSSEDQRRIRALGEQREQLEGDISRRSAGYYERPAMVTLAAVKAAIPPGAVLLEYFVYRPLDASAAVESANKFGEPRYAVYVQSPDGDGTWKDLGSAADIDGRVAALRQALRDPYGGDVKTHAGRLYASVFEPVRDLVGNSSRLLIAPDGQLSLIPFEALVDRRGRYLVEQFPISYLSAGRDLLRMKIPRESKGPPLVVANPIFGEPVESHQTAAAPKAVAARRSVTAGANASSLYFAPLRGTQEEARVIGSLFPDAKIMSRSQASESALKREHAPRILHIATHGFFIEEGLSNPLLRSGLALSGANLRRGENDDGMFTALEAAQLDLWGTKLVTLSACDTGVGVVRSGDGVFGLRRSIFLAGAETLVMSLWPVSDYVTREMMNAYYSGLKRGLGRGEALRRVQLATLARKGREHPFYWASFIQSGQWASLDAGSPIIATSRRR